MDDEANVAHRFKIGRTSNDFILKPKHKIFLSHSGVQKEFVWHLCEALERRRHNPFFDKLSSSLPKGERFPELILKAAKQCEMAVVVVSEEYFMSKWPMIELHAFVQAIKKKSNTKLKILPLFYGLSVSEFLDEKRQKRWFQVWKKWAKDDPKKRIKVGEWKEALDFLRSYNGIAYNRELQEIVPYQNDIVSHICGLISPDIKWYDSHVQGKSNICKVVYEEIEKIGHLHGCATYVVGMYGVGGIGKTTLCKILCNELSDKYEGRTCHVELKSKDSSLMELFRKILIELTTFSPTGCQELNEGHLKDILEKRISSQKTFLALDNVWNDFQSLQHARMILEAPFLKGSLVFVTARSKSTLELLGLHGDACIEMPELGEGDAINLFLYHAARGKQFRTFEEKYDILQCVRRCYFDKGGGQGFHYHPLALEALGLQLRCVGDKPLEWMKNLPKVRNFSYFAGENPVFDILRSSFDLLPHTEQSLFLDLIHYTPFAVVGCKFGSSMVDLMEWLCLVYKVDEDEIRSRLDRLKGKGLLQDVDLTSRTISVHDLYIEFAALELEGKLDQSTALEDRRWMKIMNGDLTELERTPSGRCWQKLVRLGIFHRDGSSSPPANPIESLEGIEWQYFSNVVILELEGLDCLRGTLNLKGLKCLRSLHLGNIQGLDPVEGLEGLKNLSYLKWFHFGGYGGDYLETRIGQFPASLRVLHIGVGIWLRPNVLARCNNLRKLTLSWIRADTLDLSDCSSLQSVTLNDARVRKLQFLSITGRCASSLQSLNLLNIRDLAGIPGLDQLIGLERLVLSYCSLKELPDLQKLTKLQVLDLMGPFLKRKGGLEVTGGYCIPPQLRELRFWWRWREPLNLNYGFERLQVLTIHYCYLYKCASGLVGLPALRSLSLHGCSRLPDLSKSRNLEELKLLACEVELCEEDIRMLASLPLLQPVKVHWRIKLDLSRRKVLRRLRSFEWKESDLGMPPIKIGRSFLEDNGLIWVPPRTQT